MKRLVFAITLLLTLVAARLSAAELGRFSIREPLGLDWTDEWLTEEVDLQIPAQGVKIEQLRVLSETGEVRPAQFYLQRKLIPERTNLLRPGRFGVYFKVSLPRDSTRTFRVTDERTTPSSPASIRVVESGGKTVIDNGVFVLEFDAANLLPINTLRPASSKESLGHFRWPANVQATNVNDVFSERGPVRVTFRREFQFKDPGHYCNYRFEIRAGDPWLGIQDSYNLGDGAAVELDLRRLNATKVWHPAALSARTLAPGGSDEDSTLQPAQHPIATLAPLWREHWYGGGPFAFVYRPDAPYGLGVAAVQPGAWNCRIDIAMESQSIEVHGDRQREGQISVRLPMDGAHRSWALIVGHPDIRHQLSGLTRRADLPLDRVLRRWKLEWTSSAPDFKAPLLQEMLSGHLNRPALNPVTFAGELTAQVDEALKFKHVKSRDLAALAYILTGSDYWVGPEEAWKTRGPSLQTFFSSIPLRIGLLMPEHPEARQWVQYGIRETHLTLMSESWPGGAWSESLGHANSYFRLVDNVRLLRDYAVTNGFQSWPRLDEVAHYLAAMHTPEDPRYGSKQIAPIGEVSRRNYLPELQPFDPSFDAASREFKGFGALLRSSNSFVTLKAGPARHNFHGDELSFHFITAGAPLVIDHASAVWSGADRHNRPDLNGKTPSAVAEPRAFRTSPAADLFVADERATNILSSPALPSTFLREADAWRMRRYTMLVKHEKGSKLPDYLVIRDEIISNEPVGWNLHALARDIQQDAQVFRFPGQLGVDVAAHFLHPRVKSVQKRESGWSANQPDKPGKIVPENFKPGTWKLENGEHTKWLRVGGDAGLTHWFVVLVPQVNAKVESLSATSARVTLENESEVIHLGTDGKHQAAVERAGQVTVLLDGGSLRTVSETPFSVTKPTRGRKPNL